MSLIDDVRTDRQPLALVLKKHRGIRRIVEDLYPDRAHFIYELLQNAEDTRATEAQFVLQADSVSFEHNGRPFSEKDVWGITDIGEGAKADEEDQIGRFGVGFKAVFAYTETPHIWSPTYSFKISELVLPTSIPPRTELGSKTYFEFPFNSPKKSAQDAYAEVQAGLEELAETTLLFLSHLQSIRWQIGTDLSGEVLRRPHSETHIEVLKRAGDKTIASSHFLRFCESVRGLEKQQLAVAFELDHLPNVSAIDPEQPLAKQLRVIPANPGRVAVFFPAEKETSGLRFHLHAPFVPELSRASVKESIANAPLFDQLADLAAASLHTIRDHDLLTSEFLGVLPNRQDAIPSRYEPIREAIIDAMDNEPLTPTHSKSHYPAKYLLQGKAALKELLALEDIEYLVDYDEEPPQWAISASQRNSNADRFLSGLAIREWDSDAFIDFVTAHLSQHAWRSVGSPPRYVQGPDPEVTKWLHGHSPEWHQRLYAFMHSEIAVKPSRLLSIKSTQMIRTIDGTYSVGAKCFYPTDGARHDDGLPRVDKEVYSSGKSRAQQEESKKLLDAVGVRDVGEADQIRAILEQRYRSTNFKPDFKDLPRFIALVDKEASHAQMFAGYHVFKLASGQWGTPEQAFLDAPFLTTGLSDYYAALGEDADRTALSEDYTALKIGVEKLARFCEQVGGQARLAFSEVSCTNNPAVEQLVWRAPGGWSDLYGINRDYVIDGLRKVLAVKSEAIARLIWNTACEQRDANWLKAQYRKNSNYAPREAPSQVVCILRDSEWIPQTDGRFVRPSLASRALLPPRFNYDEHFQWLEAIGFAEDERARAETEREQSEERKRQEQSAKEMGFADQRTLERARKFAALPHAVQERVLDEIEKRTLTELPSHEPGNAERRADKVRQRAAQAPQRSTESRTRSVSIGREEVKSTFQND